VSPKGYALTEELIQRRRTAGNQSWFTNIGTGNAASATLAKGTAMTIDLSGRVAVVTSDLARST
jgi:hypothetical protein